MRVLFDHNVSRRLRSLLPEHEVEIAYECGWSTLDNGRLLAAAEAAGFEVLLTADQNMVYQQNNARRRISLVVLGTTRRRLIELRVGAIRDALARSVPGSYELVRIVAES